MEKFKMKIGLAGMLLISSASLFAQHQDSLKMDSLISYETRSEFITKQYPHVEIYKLNAKRSFKLSKNQRVRVYSVKTKTDRIQVKGAIISEIKDHVITFNPTSKRFNEISYADSILTYIEIVTVGSVIRGIVINAVLVSVVAAVIVVALAILVVSRSTMGFDKGITMLPWNNFHKHIRIINHGGKRKWGGPGVRKWGVRIVGS